MSSILNLHVDLFALSVKSALHALRIEQLLKVSIAQEAKRLLDDGFLVPAPQVLEHAARIFSTIFQKSGQGPAMGQDTTQQRLDLICAFGSALNDMEREVDLMWSGVWTNYRQEEGAAMCNAAINVLAQWNAGHRVTLLAQLEMDWKAAFEHEVWCR